MKIVSVLNHKGGVGKTTFTGSTAQALALAGFRVLAVDNDSQHNLSTMLGAGSCTPGIADIYRSRPDEAPAVALKSVHTTAVPGLHVITSRRDLCDGDVPDRNFLKTCLDACGLERFYDYILIDNAPGMDALQSAAIAASQEIFVPTELRQFAVDGITEMERILRERFPAGPQISRIIPNFFRDTKRHNAFLAALHALFPGLVTQTVIPVDPVFDELITESKILFLHRLYSRGAATYLKLMHELFALDEEQVWDRMMEQRRENARILARRRLLERRSVHTGGGV